MNNALMTTKLFAPNLIKALIYAKSVKEENPNFVLLVDNHDRYTLKIDKIAFQFGTNIYDLIPPFPIELGRDYKIVTEHYGTGALDVSNAPTFEDFEDKYFYDGDDLGAVYSKEATTFTLWAPLASRVYVKIMQRGHISYHWMKRLDKGIYRVKIAQNLDRAEYLYGVTNNGLMVETPDPYARATTANGQSSVVYNPKRTVIDLNHQYLGKFSSPTEAIIYETSVRDMTIDKTTDIKRKGQYLGLIEKNRTARNGFPAGFDYLTQLGITHLQLMPILDFVTIDENKPLATYNWGYDPGQFFVPDGAYASDVNNPYTRIKEFKMLVSAFHQKGIRINLDVVFNHVYEASFSLFEQVVPNYYFRRNAEGKRANGTGCGNELASERKMVRKLIVDACRYWLEEYGIDGLRFDLMGILDIATMREIEKVTKKIKPDFMLYGEGWNMGNLPYELRASQENSLELPGYSFFNDGFRDIVKGPSADDRLAERGYLFGNADYRLGFKFAYVGGAIDLIFPRRYLSAAQSINYVECHDNATLADKLQVANSDEPEIIQLKRINMHNAVVMLAFGVPFFHKGQEIGVSKFGDTNSYRSGDRINQFAYVLLDNRLEMVHYFRQLTELRKDCPFLRVTDPAIIEELIEYEDLPEGGLLIDYVGLTPEDPYRKFKVFINISTQMLFYELEDYEKVIFNNAGYVKAKGEAYVQNLMIAPLTILVTGLRQDDAGTNLSDTKNA
ncbi:MAG: type I pullulanase [Bacilli bacterium]|jgi:pullulanase|nr:type I pullulanase [Bacilli bacterium]MDD3388910.1 type I pullulanase [Bacilli bacterium]MDD4344636.1 type I pullulanase [Bacilli bacterium]MDD4520590.1 type I pullulanase [Bacilli bacterium]MDY0399282.1 type I pullulanase [Bacilli bacterium]